MCNRATLKNCGTLGFVPNQCKTQEMCNNAVDNYIHALEFAPDWSNTQQICIKAVDYNPSTIKYDPDQYKTQKVCVKLLMIILMYRNFSLIHVRLKICLMKLFIIMLMH